MKKHNVLLIDDDTLFLFLTSKILQNAIDPKKIEAIDNVAKAEIYLDYCILETEFPDLILVDINMPGQNGMDFSSMYNKRYASKYPKTRLVMLSSSFSPKDKEKALSIPSVQEFIQKPLTGEKLKLLLA